MAKKPTFDPRKLMERAVEVMKASVREQRSDDTITPKVGAVLWKPDGAIQTAFRGELRESDHAEYTIIERKNGREDLGECVLFATLETCGPKSRNEPKIGCSRRITNARIKTVYYGCLDPHPKVAGEGLRYLQQMGVKAIPFDRDLQEIIEEENAAFFDQARRKAMEAEAEPVLSPSRYNQTSPEITFTDLDQKALNYYRNFLINDHAPDDDETFHRRLFHQGLLERTENGTLAPTRFAHILFGKHPRDILPEAGILATIYGQDGEDLKDFDGPMVLGSDAMLTWLKEKFPDPINRSSAQRKSVNAAFYELVREGIANAIVHRDYDIEGSKIQLVIDGDTVTIRSPGTPPDPITIEQLQCFSAPMVSRNPRLHAVFSTMELAEERGLGLKSMRTTATEAGLPLPKFRFNEPYLDLVIYRTEEAVIGALAREVQKQLSNDESERFKWVARRETTTSAEFAKEFAVDTRTARRNLNKYADLGLVETLGDARARKYRTKIHE